ncbi:MAG TPA: HAD-IIIC family phosphatase [Candidatus Xenobia bacterium]|jgi:FkbH-like protein
MRDVVVMSTFEAEPLREGLEFWLHLLGLPWTLAFRPAGQVFQSLLQPSAAEVNVVLVRPDDWRGPRGNLDWFETSLRAAVVRDPGRYLLALSPSDNQARFEAIPGLAVVTLEEAARRYSVSTPWEVAGPIPYRASVYAALATALARRLVAWYRPACKVLVVDCDQTLWRGVCAEEDVTVSPEHRALQALLVEQVAHGRLLCLCSKNAEADVWAVFDRHSDMPLQRSHLAAARINWEPKSDNLRELAEALNVSLESMMFLDDDPVEVAEVQARCPSVTALPLPVEATRRPGWLRHVWALDGLSDGRRTQWHHDHAAREACRAQAPTLAIFLAQLGLQLDVAPLSDTDLPRAAELSLRTTQFHLQPRPWTEGNLARRRAHGICVGVRCQDRFGDYGLVGVMCAEAQGGDLQVDGFMLSCRALGRGVEHRMLAWLGQAALSQGLQALRLTVSSTPRNAPARQFLAAMGGELLTATGAAGVRWQPPTESPPPRPPIEVAAGPAWDPARLHRIATELSTADAILRQVRLARGKRPELSCPYSPPTNPTESTLAAILEELLRVQPVGRDDNFYELGGHSLLAAQVLAAIDERLGVRLSPVVLFRGPFTVAHLAVTVSETTGREGDDAELERVLAELAPLSDDEVRTLLHEGA